MSQKDIRIEIKVRNNLVLSRMEEKGIKTIAELCRQTGLNNSRVGDLVNMKNPARGEDGEWTYTALRLAEFLGCLPEDLFSAPQQFQALQKNRAKAEVTFTELQQLAMKEVSPEALLQASQLKLGITQVLGKLPPREERILRMRFGFENGREMTLEEIGEAFGVSGARIRELEARALRRLKHPAFSRFFKAGVNYERRIDGYGTEHTFDRDVLDAL